MFIYIIIKVLCHFSHATSIKINCESSLLCNLPAECYLYDTQHTLRWKAVGRETAHKVLECEFWCIWHKTG